MGRQGKEAQRPQASILSCGVVPYLGCKKVRTHPQRIFYNTPTIRLHPHTRILQLSAVYYTRLMHIV